MSILYLCLILQPVYGVAEMFQVGQYVSVMVTDVDKRGKSTRVTLSMDPKDLHVNYAADIIAEPMVFTGAIQSVEDHRYVVDLGVSGAHTFLPFEAAKLYIKNFNNKKPLGRLSLIKLYEIRSSS